MFKVGADWNPKQAQLKILIRDPDRFAEAISLCRELHGMVHFARLTGREKATFGDEAWAGVSEEAFSIMPTSKDVTIGWNFWHITRIEDLTVNLLIQEDRQVLDKAWMERLRVGVTDTDTGNAMSDEEIIHLSQRLDKAALWEYRMAVGRSTRRMLDSLAPGDLKRKMNADAIQRILKEGGVTTHPDSIWLLDFWGKKDVAGLLMMPVTRHQAGHLNDCIRLKEKIRKMKLTC